MIGLSIYNSVLLELRLPRVVYKKLVGENVSLSDIQEFDPQLYTTLRNVAKEDAEAMDITFSVSFDNYGMEEVVDLIERGREVKVNNENKESFVQEYVDWYLNRSVKVQFDAFMNGFYKVVSKESIRVKYCDVVVQ